MSRKSGTSRRRWRLSALAINPNLSADDAVTNADDQKGGSENGHDEPGDVRLGPPRLDELNPTIGYAFADLLFVENDGLRNGEE